MVCTLGIATVRGWWAPSGELLTTGTALVATYSYSGKGLESFDVHLSSFFLRGKKVLFHNDRVT